MKPNDIPLIVTEQVSERSDMVSEVLWLIAIRYLTGIRCQKRTQEIPG
jgi:hypothetical protein